MNPFQTILHWLRAGYPDGVPQGDYVALLGVLRRSLTPVELENIVRTLAPELNGVDPEEAVEHVRQAIAQQTQYAFIAQIMQIQSRMPHKNIPQKYLDDLHTLLYADDYDEDAIKQELAEKKLSSYAASVFQTMTDKTGLTEGFMPIPAKKGRKSKEILKFVK